MRLLVDADVAADGVLLVVAGITFFVVAALGVVVPRLTPLCICVVSDRIVLFGARVAVTGIMVTAFVAATGIVQ
jgi:hypothetical protein